MPFTTLLFFTYGILLNFQNGDGYTPHGNAIPKEYEIITLLQKGKHVG